MFSPRFLRLFFDFVSFLAGIPEGKRLLPLVIFGIRLAIVVGCTRIAAPDLNN